MMCRNGVSPGSDPTYIRSVQINLNHSKSASAELLSFIINNNIDISFIQEPWVNSQNLVCGLSLQDYNLFYTKCIGEEPLTCIVHRRNQ